MRKDVYLLFDKSKKNSQRKANEIIGLIPPDVPIIRCGAPEKWSLVSKSKNPCLLIFPEKETYKAFINSGSLHKETLKNNISIIHDKPDKEIEMLANGSFNKKVHLLSNKTSLSKNINLMISDQAIEIHDKHESKDSQTHEKKADLALRKTLRELQLKNKELEKINFELDRFVYSVSHDLRAPLTSVLGLVHLLREEIKDESHQFYFHLMVESISKLDNTIRDILAYARNNRMNVVKEELNIKAMTASILENLSYLNEKNLDVRKVVVCKGENIIYGDRVRMQTLINNLLSNAIKYRYKGRKLKIEISCKILRNRIHLNVKDNGMGIEQRHLPYIFDMFYRTDERSSGSGLGLYIVKETILKLKGKINVKSVVGEGTEIDISLPA
ncbi:MAG: sensor histidine kinase [Flavobacteriales bacterium]